MRAPVATGDIPARGTAIRVFPDRWQVKVGRRATSDDVTKKPNGHLLTSIAAERLVGSHINVKRLPGRAAAEEADEEGPVGGARQPSARGADRVVSGVDKHPDVRATGDLT